MMSDLIPFRGDRLYDAKRGGGIMDWPNTSGCEEQNGGLQHERRDQDGEGHGQKADIEFEAAGARRLGDDVCEMKVAGHLDGLLDREAEGVYATETVGAEKEGCNESLDYEEDGKREEGD